MIPPALWRASTITGCPTLSEIFCPSARARMSGAPPGEELTMNRIGFAGYCCAAALNASTQPRRKAEGGRRKGKARLRESPVVIPPSSFRLPPSARKPPGFLRRHPRRRREDEVLLGEQLLAPAPRFGVAPLVRLGASVYRLGVADPAELRFELARHPGVAPLLDKVVRLVGIGGEVEELRRHPDMVDQLQAALAQHERARARPLSVELREHRPCGVVAALDGGPERRAGEGRVLGREPRARALDEGGEEVHVRGELARYPAPGNPRPRHDERHAGRPLVEVLLAEDALPAEQLAVIAAVGNAG